MTYDDRDRDMREVEPGTDPVPGENEMRDDLELRRQTGLDDTPATTEDEGQTHEGGEPTGDATPGWQQTDR
jgi:hypothetical protein